VPRSVNVLLQIGRRGRIGQGGWMAEISPDRRVEQKDEPGVTMIRGIAIDLSLGGLRMRTSEGSACPAAGSAGLVEMHLASGWHRLRVKVVRSGFDEIALHFHDVAPAVEDAIEDEVVACIEATRKPHIVVVDPSPDRRHRIAESLRTAGCDPVEAATPLEAIGIVERECGAIRGMTVSQSLTTLPGTQTGAEELCDYVSQSNPEIQLRLIAQGTCDLPLDDVPDELAAPPRPTRPRVVTDDDSLDLALRDFAADAARTLQRIESE
jgi:CheY-like chemotaxis protein